MITERDTKQMDKITDGVFSLFSRTITSELLNGEYILARGNGSTYLMGIPGHIESDDYSFITDENMSQIVTGDTLFWFMADAKAMRKALRSTKEEGKTVLSSHGVNRYGENYVRFTGYDTYMGREDGNILTKIIVPTYMIGHTFEISINKRQYANVLAAMEGLVSAYIIMRNSSFQVVLIQEDSKRFAILMGVYADLSQFAMHSKGIWEATTRQILKDNGSAFGKHGIDLTRDERDGLGRIASSVSLDMYWNARYEPFTAAYEIAQKYQVSRAAMIARIQERDPLVMIEFDGDDYIIHIDSRTYAAGYSLRGRLKSIMQDCGYELREVDTTDEKVQMGSGYYARTISRFSAFVRVDKD